MFIFARKSKIVSSPLTTSDNVSESTFESLQQDVNAEALIVCLQLTKLIQLRQIFLRILHTCCGALKTTVKFLFNRVWRYKSEGCWR